MSAIRLAIAGLGSRGRDTYGRFALEHDVLVTAVADPDEARLAEASETFGIPESRLFRTSDELLNSERLADALLICTPDTDHFNTAVKALKKGYHLLLEKPIATWAGECEDIARAARENNRYVVVSHVLRYSPFYNTIKKMISDGVLGDIVTVNAVENVGYYHHAHSFVRGNWADTRATSPMILQKCCHDIDILLYLIGHRIKSVSSYGGLYYFRPDRAPEGAARRCLNGCKAKSSCPYDAEKIYLTGEATGVAGGNTGWPLDVLAKPVTEETIRRAIETGPYGRCVFFCGNDAVDHQVVNLELEDGVTAHLTMSAFSPRIYRTIQIMGTLGHIEGDMRTNKIKLSAFGRGTREFDASSAGEYGGHGGGDGRLFESFIKLLSGETDAVPSSIENSVESHLACFAAEHSRLNGGAAERMR